MIKAKALFILLFLFYFSSAQTTSLVPALQQNLIDKFQHMSLLRQLNEKDRQISNFYKMRNFKPHWVTDSGPSPVILAILKAVKQASNEGLEPKDYLKKLTIIEDLMVSSYTLSSLYNLEILVSELAMDYIDDLFGERLKPKNISPLFYISPSSIDASKILQRGFENDASGQWFQSLTVNRAEYQALKQALAYYRSLSEQSSWLRITPPKSFKNFEYNMGLIAQLQSSLKQYELYKGKISGIFEDKTAQALIKFQEHFGQEPDGLLGPDTLKALNTLPEERIKQIIVSMERWRWFPHNTTNQYIIVNIPAFLLSCFKGEQEILQMPIITGQKLRKTPVFSSAIFEIRFNPVWHVPRSIAVKDKLPLLQKNPYLLETKGYIIHDQSGNQISPTEINWTEVSVHDFPFSLTQSPGAANALGRIFFNIQSPFGIFLHDTPDTQLFKKAKRNLSSGCIRVAKPIELALFILGNIKEANLDFIQNRIESNQTTSIHLPNPIPVHITYLTAWSGEDGQINFSDDIYDLDQKVWQALSKRTQSLQ